VQYEGFHIILSSLDSQGKIALTDQVSMVKVHIATLFIQSLKATIPDGFQPIFFKHIWDVEGEYVWKHIHSFSSSYIHDKIT